MNPFAFLSADTADQTAQFVALTALKSALLLAAVLVGAALLRRRAAALRHWVLALGLAGALLLPLLASVTPAWSLAVLPAVNTPAPQTHPERTTPYRLRMNMKPASSKASAAPAAASAPAALPAASPDKPVVGDASSVPAAPEPLSIQWTPAQVALLVWLVGATAILLRGLRQLQAVRQVTARANPAGTDWTALLARQTAALRLRRRVRLLVSAEVQVPMTWGLLEPVILLPVDADGWDEARRAVVLLHELAHIARWDYLTQWISLTSCALNWFNPLAWKANRRLALEREQASDDWVLNSGVRGTDYASHLLDIARSLIVPRRFQMIGLAMAGHSDLERRIRGILNARQVRRPSRRTQFLALAILLLLLLPMGGLRLSQIAAQSNTIVITVAATPGLKEGINDLMVKDFEEAHPGVTIMMKDAPRVPDAADDLNAYFTALQDYASSADVLYFEGYNLALSPFATRAGYILDLTPLIKSDKEALESDFYPQFWSAYQWDNGIWALPMGADMVMLVYKRSAFDAAGLAYPDGTWTVDDFASAAAKLTQRDANNNVVSAGFANSGRIMREAFWRSLMTADAADASALPNAAQLSRQDIEKVVGTYHQLEQQGVIGGDVGSAAMYADTARKVPPPDYGWSLLPGGKSVLLSDGFAVSAGTEHPDLAYDFIKTLTAQSDIIGPIAARKSVTGPNGFKDRLPDELQAEYAEVETLFEQGFANSLNYANLRFGDYLNRAWNETTGSDQADAALQAAETRANSDLSAADAKKQTLALTVEEASPPVIPPGKIALNFNVMPAFKDLPNQKQWDQVLQDFAASDPQVGLVNLRVIPQPVSVAAAQSDCFYRSSNAVPTITDGSLLPLDPYLNADASFNPSDYAPSILAAVQRGSQTYALPLTIQPLILRYSGDRFTEANLPAPTNTWTAEAFTDALNALKPGSQGQAPFVDGGSNGTYLLVLIAAYGALPIDYRTSPPTIHFTDSEAAIRQVLDLAKAGDIRYGALGNIEGDSNINPTDTTAIYPTILDNTFIGRKVPPGTTPDKPVLFPQGRDYTGLAYSLGAAYISAGSQNPEACYRLIRTLAAHPELFPAMPASHALLSDAAFKASTDADTMALYQQVDALLNDARTIAMPMPDFDGLSISDFLLQHWLFEAFDSYVLNNGDLTTALQDAQRYASDFQTCAANLPPVMLGSVKEGASALVPYADCAEGADPRLKPIIDPMVGR
jgi:ABC-type glycerol-3-phosphate transport system substrate-binding protein/beta-lactamase regulating signal transducer with metallopeptidase domain